MPCIGGDPDFDPDPYQGRRGHPEHVYQLTDTGEVDRRPARRHLEAQHLGGCGTVPASPACPVVATTGHHHPTDNHPPRRIDRWYATDDLPDNTVTSLRTISADRARTATDHLSVIVDIDDRALARA
ncbi:hypothetical protein [Salinispora arenicola]|uniref:hypothetical protein n=1 Tax=Salinispora arenicola TaxID=168697 RepID=UPI002079C27D|nr:hypothetical protein [Salinispora arenicola]MCN0178641.1 hypothetical protein [Salinispora arenicola]